MTVTASRVYQALVCDEAFTAGVGGEDAWAEIIGDQVAVTPAFRDSDSSVGAAPNVVEALVDPNGTAARLAQLAPSPALVEVLDVLSPVMLDVDGQIDALVAVERHIGLLQARSAELLAALDASERSKDGFTRDHVAAALRVPPGSMRNRMADASDLVGRLPPPSTCCGPGTSRQRHATDLAEATRSLTPPSIAAVEGRGGGAGGGTDPDPVPGVGETGGAAGRVPGRGGARPHRRCW